MRGVQALVCYLATAVIASPTPEPAKKQSKAAFSVYMNALGMGVKSRTASTNFYAKHFGIKKSLTMPVVNTGQGGWTEDIDTFPKAARSSALVTMEWTDRRNTQNLPVKLQFAVQDPKAFQAQLLSGGGKPAKYDSEGSGSLFALDPDGYTIELVQGTGIPQLKSIGVGVANLNASAAWWAGATGLRPDERVSNKIYDSISLKGEKGSSLTLISWHETPKRATSNLPIKLVFATSDQKAFQRSIQSQNPRGKQAGSLSMFQFEPLERTLIEINSANMRLDT